MYGIVDQMRLSSSNSYVKALTPSATVLGDKACEGVIKIK